MTVSIPKTLPQRLDVDVGLTLIPKTLPQRLDDGDRVFGGVKVRQLAASAGAAYSHLIVSNFSDSVTTIPADVMREAQGEGAGGVPMRAARGGAAEDNVHRLDPNANPLLLFLQSMMPWNAAPLADDDDDAGVDADMQLARQLQRQMMEEEGGR